MPRNYREHSVLVVDDDPLFSKAIGRSLKRDCWSLTSAESVDEALRIAERDRPEVVLLDVMMPGGGAVAYIQRAQERRIDIPMVMMSGVRSILKVARDNLRDSIPFLEKPFTTEAATATLRRAMSLGQERTLMDEPPSISPQRELDALMVTLLASGPDWPGIPKPLHQLWQALIEQRPPQLDRDFVAAAKADPDFEAGVLKLLNRLTSGGRHGSKTLREAIARLPPSIAASVVLECGIRQALTSTVGSAARPQGMFFRQMCAAARVGAQLRLLGPDDVDWTALSATGRFARLLLRNASALVALRILIARCTQSVDADDLQTVLFTYQAPLSQFGAEQWKLDGDDPRWNDSLHAANRIGWRSVMPPDSLERIVKSLLGGDLPAAENDPFGTSRDAQLNSAQLIQLAQRAVRAPAGLIEIAA